MTTIETTAILEDRTHLRLAEPLQETLAGPVRVILIFPDSSVSLPTWPPGYLDAVYGSCRDDPLELPPELPYETNRQPLVP